jgi:hypothetical protein
VVGEGLVVELFLFAHETHQTHEKG